MEDRTQQSIWVGEFFAFNYRVRKYVYYSGEMEIPFEIGKLKNIWKIQTNVQKLTTFWSKPYKRMVWDFLGQMLGEISKFSQ